MRNTRIWYGYQPHNGRKLMHSIVLAGEMTQEDIQGVRRSLNQGKHFIPAQVGLSPLNSADENTQVWHTLDVSEITVTPARPTVFGISARELAEKFAGAAWNPGLETARLFAENSTAPAARSFMRHGR